MKKYKVVILFSMLVLLLSGCTKSLCTEEDRQSIISSLIETNEAKWTQEANEKNIDPSLIDDYIQDQAEQAYANHPKACITNVSSIDEISGAEIEAKSWGAAFDAGLIEGLLVYPISMMLIFFTNLFGGNGIGQVLSIILVTIIIRLLTLLITLKSSMQVQKMQSIQPQLNEIQVKIKETTDPLERQKLSMKMMEIYRKNNINPLSSLLMPFVSFPIFIGVWGAVSGTLILRSGNIFGVNLGINLNEQIFALNLMAILLFFLMGISQFAAMKLPMMLSQKDNKKKNNYNKSASNQMAMFSNIMFIMILVSGFALPAAMVLYWTVGALFGIGQTFLLRYINSKNKDEKKGKRLEKAVVLK